MQQNKISVLELIKESETELTNERENERKTELNKKLNSAFLLTKQIISLNGHYCKTQNRNNFKVYYPKNPKAQKEKINELKQIEPILIKAQIGYIPFLAYPKGFL